MAAGQLKQLHDETISADGTTFSDPKSLPLFAVEVIGTCTVSSRVDGTYTVTIQHSPDGSNWHDLILIAAVSSDSQEIAFAATAAFPHTRAKIVASSVTSGADVRVDLHHN